MANTQNVDTTINGTAPEVGMTVRFRDEFSSHLIGMVFEIDKPVRIAAATHGKDAYAVVGVRIRIKGRWNYRSAALRDLIVVESANSLKPVYGPGVCSAMLAEHRQLLADESARTGKAL